MERSQNEAGMLKLLLLNVTPESVLFHLRWCQRGYPTPWRMSAWAQMKSVRCKNEICTIMHNLCCNLMVRYAVGSKAHTDLLDSRTLQVKSVSILSLTDSCSDCTSLEHWLLKKNLENWCKIAVGEKDPLPQLWVWHPQCFLQGKHPHHRNWHRWGFNKATPFKSLKCFHDRSDALLGPARLQVLGGKGTLYLNNNMA